MNAEERASEMRRLKEEIKNIWFSLGMASCFVLLLWWFLEPTVEEIINLGGNKLLTTVSNVFFDYISVGTYYIGLIFGLIVISRKKRAIRRYKKEKDVPSKINIQKSDINLYEKGDRDTLKRVFNQNNKVFTNKTRSKGSPTRSYNGSTRPSNSTENNNIALDIALGSSNYSTGNDKGCSSSIGSGYDGGSSCD
ncbi:hypothetical protein P5815_29025 [Bacillus cereus]|uniref:hypothetical protein n=1 Tax=Bacillus cereus TaxID=1396 RepID=UPI002405926E|nr:hypothetical protein [Bacillus cereus]MDF9524537.1 hypothetical protein [Bacillus cereus]MDF9564216.1 hypothetical protein [Bacillus cereus]